MTDQKPIVSPWRTDFENAPSPCIGWCTPPAGDDVRQIWHHPSLKGAWSAHSVTQAVKAWQPMPSINGTGVLAQTEKVPLGAEHPDNYRLAFSKRWTPDQFWQFIEGLTDPFVRDQIRDTMIERGLSLTPAQGSPEPDAWQWRYVGDRYWKTRSGGLKLTPSDTKNERPIEQRPLYASSLTSTNGVTP